MNDLTPYIFGAITLAGVLYFIYSLIFGDVLGDVDVDIAVDLPGDAQEFGLTVLAAFLAGFGAVGLFGTLSEWSLILTLSAAAIFGMVVGGASLKMLRYVIRQQSTDVTTNDKLVGSVARVTIHTPAGRLGEAMIEDRYVQKFRILEIGNQELQQGDIVDVIAIDNGTLQVKKKRRE